MVAKTLAFDPVAIEPFFTDKSDPIGIFRGRILPEAENADQLAEPRGEASRKLQFEHHLPAKN